MVSLLNEYLMAMTDIVFKYWDRVFTMTTK
jgi:hypothetical protein